MPELSKESERVLIIKTGYSEVLHNERDSRRTSLGDVLRTTPILHLFKDQHVTWVTDERALPLLQRNPYIHRLLVLDWITARQLDEERFDTIINLEKIPGICVLADDIKSKRRYGFRSENDGGIVVAEAYDHASEALSLSLDQQQKQGNSKSVQQLLFEMLGREFKGEDYTLGYQPTTSERFNVALNTRIGTKWPTKAWPKKYWEQLEAKLIENRLTVTRDETAELNGVRVTDGTLYDYMDWINSARLVVSNDSLGLHLGLALKKKVLGIFGSTSEKEVYFYNRGKPITPNREFTCSPCFSPTCQRDKFCLESITPEQVYDEIRKLLD